MTQAIVSVIAEPVAIHYISRHFTIIFAHSLAPFSVAIFLLNVLAFAAISSVKANLIASASLLEDKSFLEIGFEPTPKS
ncbi:hypothetical protein Ccar_03635 [Clostridium carboxidivorans P7]|uniref:Uncharacterized protein n=1 Tax=Clostridium carboxidivorans P7 TaxID=536227 RepID=C6PP41_9CLOT|nr:hypothetical protein Ccar_03635 [Clostridium carboxidivorans P7]EET88919.1 hypothetical protein CcarbDRAFT_0558 [Clostridium carboxidivorans P7]